VVDDAIDQWRKICLLEVHLNGDDGHFKLFCDIFCLKFSIQHNDRLLSKPSTSWGKT